MPESDHSHWNSIYLTKHHDEVSWWENVPKTSIELIRSLSLPKESPIIDIGGGDSTLVDHLLMEGFRNLTVLDISSAALERAKTRLADKAPLVRWIVGDVRTFPTGGAYDLWHDRAAFHFLIHQGEITKYVLNAEQAINPGGFLIVGTFSTAGPKSCSGLPVCRYDETSLTDVFRDGFELNRTVRHNHTTPFNTTQNFIFGIFQRRMSDRQG